VRLRDADGTTKMPVVKQRHDATLRKRLAATRTPEDDEAVLGRRRMAAYGLAFVVIALGLLGVSVYLVLAAALGWRGPWISLWLFASLPLFLLIAPVSYAVIYRCVTGRRPPMRTAQRVINRLESEI
jgi:hypothetical protein